MSTGTKKYYRIPSPLIEEQKQNTLTRDLFLTETGEIEVEQGTIWGSTEKLNNYLLAFCTKGNGIIQINNEQVPVSNDQFFIIPKGEEFKFYSVLDVDSHFLVAYFNGKKAKHLGKEFS
ncbi:MAG: AraC family ligand binding domain-containing protein, partial [Draconibacterium sp.]|nr:AraC family ligand binding domain-containing protein [Draconibacterium sp.]